MFEEGTKRSIFFQALFFTSHFFKPEVGHLYVVIKSEEIGAWANLLAVLFKEAKFHLYGTLTATLLDLGDRLVHHKSSLPEATPAFNVQNTLYISTSPVTSMQAEAQRSVLSSKFTKICLRIAEPINESFRELSLVTPWLTESQHVRIFGEAQTRELLDLAGVAKNKRLMFYKNPLSTFHNISYSSQCAYDFVLEEETISKYLKQRSIVVNEVSIHTIRIAVSKIAEDPTSFIPEVKSFYSSDEAERRVLESQGFLTTLNPLDATVSLDSKGMKYRADRYRSFGAVKNFMLMSMNFTTALEKRIRSLYGYSAFTRSRGFVLPKESKAPVLGTGYSWEYSMEKKLFIVDPLELTNSYISFSLLLTASDVFISADSIRNVGDETSDSQRWSLVFLQPISQMLAEVFELRNEGEFLPLDVKVRIRSDYKPCILLSEISVSSEVLKDMENILKRVELKQL